MAQFMFLLHEVPGTFSGKSPAEMQAVIDAYRAWAGRLGAQGRLAGGHKLTDEGGRHARKVDGKLVVTDGPYAEAKDVVGGYFLVVAADYAEAEGLAADCPHAEYGTIEIRLVDPMDDAG